jgi:hypothetical protein
MSQFTDADHATRTKLLEIRLSRIQQASLASLSCVLQTKQFAVLTHLWSMKLGHERLDLLDKVKDVSFSGPCPESIRRLIKTAPLPVPKNAAEEAAAACVEVILPSVPVEPTPPPAPSQAPQEEPRTMKKYGRLAGRVEELVNYVRSSPPKTTAQLGRVFGVECSTIRKYLYGMMHAKVNLDVPKKVRWAGASATEVPPSVLGELNTHPMAGLVEIPVVADVVPKPKPVNSTVDTLEKLALENLRAGNIEAVQALGAALRVVEKSAAK